MGSPAFDRIMDELTVHPKERVGIKRTDIESLIGEEKAIILEKLLKNAEEGLGTGEPLEWLLENDFIKTLKMRLLTISKNAHGQVFLPYILYLKNGESDQLLAMMRAIIAADIAWEGREHALGGYLRKIIGHDPLYWDYCRYVILRAPGISLKRYAMLWLAYEKGYPLQGYSLPNELASCVDVLEKSNGSDVAALAVLDSLHSDTGRFNG